MKRSDLLRETLEQDIACGRLAPGQKLDEQAIAERFGVSRTPVREALQRLAAEGLVEMRPRQGAVVPQLGAQQLVEMFEVMAVLEGLCARLAARRMTPLQRRTLRELHDDCREAAGGDDPDRYYLLNASFHEAIYNGSHNRYLEDKTRRMRNRLSYYRRHQLHQPGRVGNSFAEHDTIVRAIVAGEDDAAEALMRRHINVQGDSFADLISALPLVRA